jgi:hypothetical protein
MPSYYGPAVALNSIGNVLGDVFKHQLDQAVRAPDVEQKYAQMGAAERAEGLKQQMLPMEIQGAQADLTRKGTQAEEDLARAEYLRGQASLVEPHRKYYEAQSRSQDAQAGMYGQRGRYYDTLGTVKSDEDDRKADLFARTNAAATEIANTLGPIDTPEKQAQAAQIFLSHGVTGKDPVTPLVKGAQPPVIKTTDHRMQNLTDRIGRGETLTPVDQQFYNMENQKRALTNANLQNQIHTRNERSAYNRARLVQLGQAIQQRDLTAQTYLLQTMTSARNAALNEASLLLSGPMGKNIEKFGGTPAEQRQLLQYYVDSAIARYMTVLPPDVQQKFNIKPPPRSEAIDRLEKIAPGEATWIQSMIRGIWDRAWGNSSSTPGKNNLPGGTQAPPLPPRDPASWIVTPDDDDDDDD